MSRAAWVAYAVMLLDHGLALSSDQQIRRMRRSALLMVTTRSAPLVAFTNLRKDTIEISDDRLQLWIAFHEMAHLLVPGSTRMPRYSRFMAVVTHMMGRHEGERAAGEFRELGRAFVVAHGSGVG